MTEIYGTLGPGCSDAETLYAMFSAGMTGVRLNLSHMGLEDASEQIDNLHAAAARAGKKAQLLIDMQGPELRIGVLDKPLTLEAGEHVRLGGTEEGGIPVPEPVLPFLRPGQEILLDDGKLRLFADGVPEADRPGAGSTAVWATVSRGGLLQSRKSIALPGVTVHTPAMTEQDRRNISLAGQYGVTAVMQPFVRGRADLETLREALDSAGGREIRIFAKIENLEGVANLDEILPASDEIVIARGDLGSAMPLWELPRVQKEIAAKCRAAGKPFMVVTQMLASMEHSPVPTRAEVSDVFNAVCDGAASVMVTGETAVGEYPAEVIRYLANTAHQAEQYRGQ